MNYLIRRNDNEQEAVPVYGPLGLFGAIDKIASDFWDSTPPYALGTSLIPHTDIYEEKNQLVMKTELPGIKKEDIEIILEGDVLTIKAEKKEAGVDGAACYTRERQFGQFVRSTTLPFPVKEQDIAATFENGVLELKLSRTEESKPKKIEIKARLEEPKMEDNPKA